MLKTHPFSPVILPETTKLLVGSLPPEGASFYFSNSSNTRLWDILKAIDSGDSTMDSGGYLWDRQTKVDLLKSLNLGIADIILEYERYDWNSGKDKDIVPFKYRDLGELIKGTKVNHVLFLYKTAARWFNHSLTGYTPVKCTSLRGKINLGHFKTIEVHNKEVKLIQLPIPLNRGGRGQTLPFKLDEYRKIITGM